MENQIESRPQNQTESRPQWTDLTTEEKNGVLALTLARSVNEAARIFKTTTGRSRAYFFATVYKKIKPFWQELSQLLPEEALRILRGGSVAAAYELNEELKHRDVKIRNKASNDILDKVLPHKGLTTPIQINIFGQLKQKYGQL
jgi:hypothetical protein